MEHRRRLPRGRRRDFFATSKAELIDVSRFARPAAATAAIEDYLAGFSNPQRRHSYLSFLDRLQGALGNDLPGSELELDVTGKRRASRRNRSRCACARLGWRITIMGYRCRTCGIWHDERPLCFVAELPAAVAGLSDNELRSRVERGSDQCILDGEHFFILGNLDVPIQGSSEHLRWTVWSTLSRGNFERTSDLWDTPGRESEPPYFGWLSNQIPGYPRSVNIKAMVHTQPVGIRPQLRVIEDGHPLAMDQKHGITEARAEELIHAALRPGGG